MYLLSVDPEQPAMPRRHTHNPTMAAIRLITEPAIVVFGFRG
jgi:hypothetical protein